MNERMEEEMGYRNAVVKEAIADADAYLNNVDLPAVAEMAEMIAKLMEDAKFRVCLDGDKAAAARLDAAKEMLENINRANG